MNRLRGLFSVQPQILRSKITGNGRQKKDENLYLYLGSERGLERGGHNTPPPLPFPLSKFNFRVIFSNIPAKHSQIASAGTNKTSLRCQNKASFHHHLLVALLNWKQKLKQYVSKTLILGFHLQTPSSFAKATPERKTDSQRYLLTMEIT